MPLRITTIIRALAGEESLKEQASRLSLPGFIYRSLAGDETAKAGRVRR